jgi:hypothetical protein
MAVTEEAKAPEQATSSAPPAPASPETQAPAPKPQPPGDGRGPGAPLWVVPLYVGGLILVYLGERVFEGTPTARWIATGLGIASVLVATMVRFAPRFRRGGERSDIERLLAVLSVVGIMGLLVYLGTTEWGQERLGFANAELETRERIDGILTVSWVTLILVSVVPMLFAEAALFPMRRALFPEARRVRAAAASGLAVVFAAAYGGLFTFASSGPAWKVDYSYFKTSGPSESTRKIAESLTQPVKVTAFFPDVNEVRTEVDAYLRDVSRGIPNLQVEVHDRLLVPKVARELRATQDGVVILSRDKITETLTIGTDVQSARPKLKTLDRDFQERLLKLLRSRRTAYLTTGHGELNDGSRAGQDPGRVGTIAKTLLQKQNYLVKDLGLAQGLGNEVPEDADIVIVLGPSEPFASEEVTALRRYADQGGKLLLALDPDALSSRDMELGEPPAGPGPEEGAPAPNPASDPHAGHGHDDPHAAPPAAASAKPAKPKPAPSAKKPAAKPEPASKPEPVASAKPAVANGKKPGKPGDKPTPPKPEPPAVTALLPTTDAARSLQELAAIGGVSLQAGILANDREHLRRRFNDSDRTLLVTNSFSSHASVSTLSRNSPRAAVVTFGAAGLERTSGSTGQIDFTVRSRPSTFADANRNYTFDDGPEKRNVFNMGAAVSQPAKSPRRKPPEPPKPEPKKDDKAKDPKKDEKKPPPDEMRAFVLGDADAFSDLVMSNVVANQVLFLDAIRWLGGEESFAGEATTEEDVRIEHTKQKDLVWFYGTIFGAPALVLGLGLFYVRRSRRTGPRGGER